MRALTIALCLLATPALADVAGIATVDQAAERLHVSPRKLRDLIQEYPFYRRAGRRILFTREDFKKLLDALPTGESEYRSVGWRQGARRYSNARAGSALEEARRLLEEPKRKRVLRRAGYTELAEVLERLEGPERARTPKKAKVVPLRGKKPRP